MDFGCTQNRDGQTTAVHADIILLKQTKSAAMHALAKSDLGMCCASCCALLPQVNQPAGLPQALCSECLQCNVAKSFCSFGLWRHVCCPRALCCEHSVSSVAAFSVVVALSALDRARVVAMVATYDARCNPRPGCTASLRALSVPAHLPACCLFLKIILYHTSSGT